jgi:acetoin utilization deacetylase AcuC-like enzyme
MTTALLTHPDCLAHVNPPGHPERPERLRAVLAALEGEEFAYLVRIEAPLGDDAAILRAHPRSYLAALEARAPQEGLVPLDADTVLGPHTLRAARRGVGAVVAAVDMVMSGEVGNAFCACRPPGHHAERSLAMGFCYFGNVVIGARHALEVHGLERVAIVDFDVHHGNGTEDIFSGDPRVLMVGIFQHPFYPYSGTDHPAPNMLNLPVPAYTKGMDIRELVDMMWLPRLEAHKPQMVFISAGFDAHREDDMAQLGLVESDYTWLTQRIKEVAQRHARGRIVSCLEGGYALSALGRSVEAHLRVLADV